MASTSTNKQPLLIDRVFHSLITSNTLASGSATDLNILGTNSAALLVDCTTNDGGSIEDMYTISRSTTDYTVLFYLSSAVDYLRAEQAVFCGSIDTATTVGAFAGPTTLPYVLAPVPQNGTDPKNTAFYVPSGKALWCTLQLAQPLANNTAPIIGAQGGFY